MSIREDILQAMVTAVDAAVGSSAAVYRSREAPVARSEGVVILVRPEEETCQALSQFRVQRDLVVMVSVIGRSQIPDSKVDAVLAIAHAALLADQTLGGLAARVIEQHTRWNFEVADQNAVSVDIRYMVRYLTSAQALMAAT